MSSPKEKVEFYCRRKWWWSPAPFWAYVSPHSGQGWANAAAEVHPGCFNLMWVSSGVLTPPAHYPRYANLVRWAMTEAQHLPMGRKTMADWAYLQTLPEFTATCLKHEKDLKRWKFVEPAMSYEQLLTMLRRHAVKG